MYRSRPTQHSIHATLLLLIAGMICLPRPAAAARDAGGGTYVEVIPLGGLDFGTVAQGWGGVYVQRTDPYVGKYKIRAKISNAPPVITVSLFAPELLSGPRGGSIPFIMDAAFNATSDDPGAATDISGASAHVTLQLIDGYEGATPVYAGYVYLYGAVTVGHVPVGDYLGMATLQAEADVSRNPCAAEVWDQRTRYYAGDVVTHDGGAWMADRMTIGNEPGNAHDWDPDSDLGTGRPWNLLSVCD